MGIMVFMQAVYEAIGIKVPASSYLDWTNNIMNHSSGTDDEEVGVALKTI